MSDGSRFDKVGDATPRTDAFSDRVKDVSAAYVAHDHWYDFAGQLERELAAANRSADACLEEIDRLRSQLNTALSAGASINPVPTYVCGNEGMVRSDKYGTWVRLEDHKAVAQSAREEVCRNPQGSHGRWSATERHCYSCGVTVKHGEELICRYPPDRREP